MLLLLISFTFFILKKQNSFLQKDIFLMYVSPKKTSLIQFSLSKMASKTGNVDVTISLKFYLEIEPSLFLGASRTMRGSTKVCYNGNQSRTIESYFHNVRKNTMFSKGLRNTYQRAILCLVMWRNCLSLFLKRLNRYIIVIEFHAWYMSTLGQMECRKTLN